MKQLSMRKGNAMVLVEVFPVEGKYQGSVRIVRASVGSFSQAYRSAEGLYERPEEAYESAKSLAVFILADL